MRKIFSALLAALLVTGMTTVVFSDDAVVAEVTQENDKNHFYGEMIDTGIRNTTDVWGWTNVIPGTAMAIGGTGEGHEADKAFDGNLGTVWDALENNWSNYKLVLKADEAVSPTGFFILPKCDQTTGAPLRMHVIHGSVIQGSNDGVIWDDIYTITVEDYEDYAFGVEDGTYNATNPCYIVNFENEVPAYRYFAYANNDDGTATATEFGLFYDADEPIDPDVTFTLGNVTGKPGETVDVTITVDSKTPINSIGLRDLTYDTDLLTFEGFVDTADMESKCFLSSFDEELNAIALALKADEALTGKICTLRFKINDNATDCKTTISFNSVVKCNSTEITSATTPAEVTVQTYVSGDISGDETVDISDALRLFQYSLMPDLYDVSYKGSMDLNSDGQIDISDALKLFQYSLMPDLYPL